ncbi:MAG: hypothetical protein E7Z92_00040 [Cyanobacteria bacterium SIG31]|nr:hypothetical protein [Cyanobacteria bacterium SIG31]
MAVNPIITQKIDENYSQVEIQSKKARTRYFKVPTEKADEFCTSYKKRNKRDTFISNAAFIGSVIAGCSILNAITKNINSAARIALGIIAGVLSAFGAEIGVRSVLAPKHEQFVQNFGAEEFYPEEESSPTVTDIIK